MGRNVHFSPVGNPAPPRPRSGTRLDLFDHVFGRHVAEHAAERRVAACRLVRLQRVAFVAAARWLVVPVRSQTPNRFPPHSGRHTTSPWNLLHGFPSFSRNASAFSSVRSAQFVSRQHARRNVAGPQALGRIQGSVRRRLSSRRDAIPPAAQMLQDCSPPRSAQLSDRQTQARVCRGGPSCLKNP